MKNVILGTAGHIDHGKSSLVKALTGIDPDRLKEEKERGITIDLGFANLFYPDGLAVGIVDVPGHERLIKNMLAGAGGIDIVLMVIAADEGIMPQTREHLSICKLLKIKTGIIAITKADLVDADWLSLITDDIRGFVKGTFLEDAVIVPVSSKTGMNIDLLKEVIRDAVLNVKPKLTEGLFRLPIDRVFTLKGFGTVVTGTALSGTISLDAPVEILPSKITSKVRGLQSHGRSVERAYAGQRIGINLQGVERESLRRGDVVVVPDRFVPTRVIDAKVDLLSDAPTLKNRSLVHFYSGTAETVARIILYDKDEISAGESCYCQFRLNEPVVVLSADRYIIRRFSPLETIGGGEILDPHPVRRKKKEGINDLITIEQGNIKDKIEVKVRKAHLNGCTISEIEGWVLSDMPEINSAIQGLVKEGRLIKSQGILFHKDSFELFKNEVISNLIRFHKENPLKSGISKEELRAKMPFSTSRFSNLITIIDSIVIEKETLRLRDFKPSLAQADRGVKTKILAILSSGGFQPPIKSELAQKLSISEKEILDMLKLLAKEGAVVRINDSMYITKEHYDKMLELLKDFYAKNKEMTVAEFRDMLGTSRKYALPLLEYLDSSRITLRVGDIRKFMLK
ncbi:selenocysteine-specific translation factor [Dissulfurispira thermophila]|uniref:Selenocysteine-specific elongation factor n=2 Tax=root TaxID=1 RepID=A0A7G1H5N1_9BACT|nr:selenocysteine-specific translation elongation factor [Dissulfurispira thermophila]BCB97236.1 selenocysteine-specific translation factor [Dissulfurispira thermophila]